ncbi:protein strawberry notch [Daphnia magna]|uniref:Strawberry notch n=1 Tax=Daphnia magna TaxID=35525 RepID=A0ABR0AVH8_9CRUS|nr:protein strawberry notch [Daphnia magna]KAK4029142.1 hypothetical protein OUZ56_022152 [Daphnia magna]
MSLRKAMATAKATAAAESKKKKPIVKSKAKIKEEVTISSEESDFDDEDDPDCVEVPGGGRDLQTITKIGSNEPSLGFPSQTVSMSDGLILPSPPTSVLRAPIPQQPGYEVIRIPPGFSPFGLGGGIKQQTPNVMQQKINLIRSGLPTTGGAVRVNVPLSAVQSMLKTNSYQNLQGPTVSIAGVAGRLVQMQMQQSANQQLLNAAIRSVAPGQIRTPLQLQQLQHMQQQIPQARQDEAEDENVEEEENMGVAETYADYMPTKVKIGRKHPDPVVETASLASVAPPDVWYKLAIPEESIDSGSLSALQLESITYSCQQHEQTLPDGSRAGYLIGDGAGVGKGRTVSGIIYENYLRGRKRAIWVSVSSDLKYDAERDLRDIGAGKISVYALNKMKYAKISADVNGGIRKGVIFSTYSSLIGESQSGGKYRTRLKQLLQWCGEDFDGVIVFDECHRAKNLVPTGSTKPTKTGLTVLELQSKLPKARVIYASATGASEPRNMAYMVRLGLWGQGTPFKEFTDFIAAVEKRGVGAMEIVAMEMKHRGMYIARQLSFKDVTFKVDEVSLSPKFIKSYDDSVKLWVQLLQSFTEAAELVNADPKMRKTMWAQFWSAHQRFFKYLCIAAKVKHAVKVASEAVKCGKCVVIGLQSTGEARTLEQIENEGELSDFVSTAKGVLQSLVDKHFPAPDRSRVLRLLGLDKGASLLDQLGIDPESYGNGSGTSGSKRKAARPVAERSKKKIRTSDSESSEQEQESDLDVDDSSSEPSDSEDPEADDYNPFGGSDNEDPWCRSEKNGRSKVKTKSKKKDKKVKVKESRKKKPDSSDEEEEEVKMPFIPIPRPSSVLEKKEDIFNRPPPKEALDMASSIKDRLLVQIEQLGANLPPNTLDQLIDELGGPENVAEMTGRKGRVVQNDDGQVQYESRSEVDVPLEILNIREKERFMAGEKDVAIISEAASSGISLQADRRVKNQRRRVHITLELPWSADRAVQQFGRTHRSNQVSAPEYIFLISNLAGERRFASIVAKRLESLGALTHGDRRATESRDLSQFNIDTKYGRAALEAIMKAVMGYEVPVVPPPADYKGEFFKDVAGALVGVGLICNSDTNPGVLALDKDYANISKFLNRILGMPVDLQNRLFQYFTDTLAAIVIQAKKSGRFDLGILDLGSGQDDVRRTKLYTFTTRHPTGTAKIELHTFEVERGMTWEEAKDKTSVLFGEHEGFYVSKESRYLKQTPSLVVQSGTAARRGLDKGESLYTISRPNTGLQLRQESLGEIKKKYRKIEADEAEPLWIDLFTSSKTNCMHIHWFGKCRQKTLGVDCQFGLRQRTYNVLSGSVLSVWTKVEAVLSANFGGKMQVVRLRSGGIRIVGTVVPSSCMPQIIKLLTEESENFSEEVF